MDESSAVELQQGPLRLALRPDCGGAIAGLWIDGLPVLRSCEPQHLASVRESGCFALVPYSNRIGRRQFNWLGRGYTLASNMRRAAHAARHRLARCLAGAAALAVGRDAGVHASERCALAVRIPCRADVRVEARFVAHHAGGHQHRRPPDADGLGWHPYFVRRARSRVHLELQQRWEADESKLPVRPVAQTTLDADVAVLDLDNCFDGWSGPARIRDERLSLRLTSSLNHAVVYTPRERDFFCVEPVSHVNNALASDEPKSRGILALGSGETARAWMQLDIARA